MREVGSVERHYKSTWGEIDTPVTRSLYNELNCFQCVDYLSHLLSKTKVKETFRTQKGCGLPLPKDHSLLD